MTVITHFPSVRASKPRVGIGMPVYNGERFIRQAIESLLSQTFADFELVIADNRSVDATRDICEEYVTKDRRVRYVQNDLNLGGPRNFRRVFELCHGEYHKWATADDWWDPTVLEKSVAVLDRRPDVVLVYPQTTIVDEIGTPIRDHEDNLELQEHSPYQRFVRLLETIDLCHAQLGVIRRSAMQRTDLMGDELASDTRFLAELSLYGKFVVLPEHLFFRRFHSESSSWDRGEIARQRRYYDPERRTRFGLHTWRRHALLIKAVSRAPIPLSDKWGLYRYLGRKLRWQRRALAEELWRMLPWGQG